MSKKVDPLAGLDELEGSDEFAMETGAWEYPGMGYNSVTGKFYLDNEQVDEVEVVFLARRRCKEVVTREGHIVRYRQFFKKVDMVDGVKVNYRIQAIVLVNGELYNFGMNSYTARAFMENPSAGKWHNRNLQPGFWDVLTEFIKKVKLERNVSTSPYCWKVKLSAGKGFDNPQNESQTLYPIAYSSTPFTFVGKAQAAANKALFEAEDLSGWVDEWDKAGGVEAEPEFDDEPGSIGSKEDDIDSIPGFDL